MNRNGQIGASTIFGIVAGILVFAALAAVGIGFFNFLKENWVWILLITTAYIFFMKRDLLKGFK